MVHVEVFDVLADRCSSYVFLSRIYREEASSALLGELVESNAFDEQASEAGTKALGEFISNLRGADLEEAAANLASEFANLFLNAGNRPVFPYESVYTSPEGLLMQEARDEVLREYHQQGLTGSGKPNEPEDHLAIELEFMFFLGQKTIEALQAEDKEQGLAFLLKQKTFLEKHLLVWCPRFCKDLELASESDFYRGLALLTGSFLDSEPETLTWLLEQVRDAS